MTDSIVEELPRDKVKRLLDQDLSDWVTITHTPECGCGILTPYPTSNHHKHKGHIIVWPSEQDRSLKRALDEYGEDHAAMIVIPYEFSMGPCVSAYQFLRDTGWL